jgi:hypothetical protein
LLSPPSPFPSPHCEHELFTVFCSRFLTPLTFLPHDLEFVRLCFLTGWTVGLRFPAEADNFSLLWPIQLPVQWARVLFPRGVKRLGRETGHSSPSSAEVKNAWRSTFTLPVRLHSQAQLCLYLFFYVIGHMVRSLGWEISNTKGLSTVTRCGE